MTVLRLINPKLFLGLICILFLLTRLYKIDEIPSSVYWDEASIGYNAYSIAQTGKDEWGDFLPLHFRAFGEFKLPVYIYSVVPFVKIFGLNEFSVRFPTVLYSLGVVILTYLLARKISDSEFVGLMSSFLISISPWFFIFSRTGYEATVGLFFYLAAILTFQYIQKNRFTILLSTILFVISAYSYNSFRIISPVTILVLLIFQKRSFLNILRTSKLAIILSVLTITVSVWPIYRLFSLDMGGSRLQAVGGTSIKQGYLSHLSLDFILNGDKNPRSQLPSFGQLYLPEIILFILGLIYIGRNRKFSLVPVLILIGLIPASITKEFPHALRSISVVPFISMMSGFGILFLSNLFKNKKIIPLVTILMLLGFFINYFLNYIGTYNFKSSKEWQYGYKRIYQDFAKEFGKYDRIIISDEYAQPYIFTLFYLKVDPKKLENNVLRNEVSNWGFSTVSKFEKFEFGKVRELLGESIGKTLVFATDRESVLSKQPISEIKFVDGAVAFWVYEL